MMFDEFNNSLVYPMFDIKKHIKTSKSSFKKYYVSCDYGTVNPFSLGLWGEGSDGWYRIGEYYHSSRDKGFQLTDEEYYKALEKLIDGRKIEAIIIDPSAASFIQTIKRHGEYFVIKANNDVSTGITLVHQAFENNEIFFYPCCENIIREFSLYSYGWNGRPTKENDHAMDDMRYFIATVNNVDENNNDVIKGFFEVADD